MAGQPRAIRMVSGIYQIRNVINGKRYIGSASNMSNRRARHFSMLRRGTHFNPVLQNAFNKHGENMFVFEELSHVSPGDLTTMEQKMLDSEHPEYNILGFARSSKGRTASTETKQKMSATHKRLMAGGIFYPEHSGKGLASQKKNGTGIFDPEVRRRAVAGAIETNRKNGTAIFDNSARLRGLATQRERGVGFFDPKTRSIGNHTRWHIGRELFKPDCVWCQGESQ